jgi:hypothetical protein
MGLLSHLNIGSKITVKLRTGQKFDDEVLALDRPTGAIILKNLGVRYQDGNVERMPHPNDIVELIGASSGGQAEKQ